MSRGHSLSPGGIDEQNRAFSERRPTAIASPAVSTGCSPSGLTYELGTGFLDSSGSGPDGPFENTEGSAGIRLAQPILKNAWIDEPRLNIKVRRKEINMSELALRGQIMNTVTSVELAYYDLLLLRENVKVQEQALALAQQLVDANRERIRQGVMAALDEKQAESHLPLRPVKPTAQASRHVGTPSHMLSRVVPGGP